MPAFDDLTAQGVLAGLSERKVSVPSSFSLIGCDDVLGAVIYPALTSVSNRSIEAGRVAVSLLLEMLQSRGIRDMRYVLETHLVIREAPPLAVNEPFGRRLKKFGPTMPAVFGESRQAQRIFVILAKWS